MHGGASLEKCYQTARPPAAPSPSRDNVRDIYCKRAPSNPLMLPDRGLGLLSSIAVFETMKPHRKRLKGVIHHRSKNTHECTFEHELFDGGHHFFLNNVCIQVNSRIMFLAEIDVRSAELDRCIRNDESSAAKK